MASTDRTVTLNLTLEEAEALAAFIREVGGENAYRSRSIWDSALVSNRSKMVWDDFKVKLDRARAGWPDQE